MSTIYAIYHKLLYGESRVVIAYTDKQAAEEQLNKWSVNLMEGEKYWIEPIVLTEGAVD